MRGPDPVGDIFHWLTWEAFHFGLLVPVDHEAKRELSYWREQSSLTVQKR